MSPKDLELQIRNELVNVYYTKYSIKDAYSISTYFFQYRPPTTQRRFFFLRTLKSLDGQKVDGGHCF